MNQEIYLHVGYLKTGSTFLQREVFPRMQAVNYVHYNRCPDAFNDIIYTDAYHFREKETESRIKKECRPGKNIISHEAFIGGDAALCHFMNGKMIAKRLANLFPGAKVLFVIRNQYDLAISLYKQYVHLGGRKPLRNFLRYGDGVFDTLRRGWTPSVTLHQLDYKPAIDEYAHLFGRENMLILPFEMLSTSPCTFVDTIVQWMGLREHIPFKNRFYNKGYGARRIAIAKFLHRFVRSPFNESPLIPDIRLPGVGKADYSLVRRILQSGLSYRILGYKEVEDPALHRDIFSYFEASNRTLNEQYGLKLQETCSGVYFR
jgi:hypothetical protein